jgi:hypothetical protein
VRVGSRPQIGDQRKAQEEDRRQVYPSPDNAVIFHADGSFRLHLKCLKLLTKHAPGYTLPANEIRAGFIQVHWGSTRTPTRSDFRWRPTSSLATRTRTGHVTGDLA